MVEFKDIESRVAKFQNAAPTLVNRGLKKAATIVGDAVIDAMPVETGALVNNWHASAEGTKHRFDRHNKGGKDKAKADLADEVRRIPSTSQNITLTNTTPYGVYAMNKSKMNSVANRAKRRAVNSIKRELVKELRKVFR